jgi:fructoselysine-6-P-deglycase FrlB-like protein
MSPTNNLLATYFDFYLKRETRLTVIAEVTTAIREKNWYLENNQESFAVSMSEKSQEALAAMKRKGFNTTDVIIFITGRAKELMEKEEEKTLRNVKSTPLVA